MFVPGGAWELADFIPELKEKFGVSSLQHTGGGSSYFPWWCGLGYPLGVYGSSEEGNTMTDPERQSHQLGWSLINGEGHHIYFHNSSHYIQMEKETGWFTKNRRLLEIYGKARWKKPRVAVLMSSLMARYFPYQNLPLGLDIGRGALQAAHYNNVYVTESMVIDGIVDSYPVLFDSGTSVMSDELVAALERYVRGGGTFVAVSNTGRHSLVEADAWPIERLSGYQVLGERKDMKLTVLPGNPLLKTLAGRSFQGSGRAINWLGQNEVPESVAMEPKGEQNTGEYETIARWSDGTVAVGMRRLGKGRVVVLGSSFWRSMDDTEGKGLLKIGPLQTVFLRDLLSGLGVSHQIDCSSERVWARRFITKNGLQEWMILYNRGSASAGDVHLTFTWPEPLDSVKDIVTGADVPVSYKDGEVHIHGLDIEPAQVKVFGVDRGDFSGAVQHWYRSKARYMTPPAVDKKPVPKPEVSQRSIVLDEFYFRKLKENDSGWLDEPVTQQSWNVVSYGFWDEMGYEPKGKCVYRTEFQLPENWKDRRVVLAFLSHDSPIFLQNATVYLNGKEVGSYQGQRWSNNEILEVTSFLKDGTNKVAFLVEAKEIRGGYLGQVVLYPLQDIGPSFDLEEWKIVGPGDENGSVTLPVSRKVQHLTCEVDVPKDWPSDRILLQWKGEMGLRGRNIALVVVNGRGIAYNSYAHPFGNIFQINLYPWIKPGERNTIQLWPLACIPSRGGLCAPNVYDVKIGVESPLKDR
jgi:hypothetical protein